MQYQKRSQKGEYGVVHVQLATGNLSKFEGRVYFWSGGVMVYAEKTKNFIPYDNILFIQFKREGGNE